MKEQDVLAFLNRKYIQRADERQKQMGLQYTEAETHDLAKEIHRNCVKPLLDFLGEDFEEAFRLVFEGYNRPGTDFASDTEWAVWQHAKLTKAFSLLQSVRRELKDAQQ